MPTRDPDLARSRFLAAVKRIRAGLNSNDRAYLIAPRLRLAFSKTHPMR